jgi:hypothetical protein
LALLVVVLLVQFPQPISLMTEIPGDEESKRFESGPYDSYVLGFCLVVAPLVAGWAGLRFGFLVPLTSLGALAASQILGGMSWDRFFHHEGPFLLLFGPLGIGVIYETGAGLRDIGNFYRKYVAPTRQMFAKRKDSGD